MRRRLLPLLLPAVLLATGTAALIARHDESQPAASPAREPPVILVLYDEFPVDALRGPDGRIDAARFPHFAALARTSTWFPNTHAAHDSTPYATPAVMDGRRPKRGRPATVRGHPRSIFTLLGDRGYRIFSNEEATDICPNRLCPGAARRRKGILTNLARGREERFDRWARSIRARDRPALYFKHALVPHLPWIFLPTGRRLKVTLGHLASPRGFHDTGLTRHNEQRFLLQVGYVDRQIGRLVRRLRREGLFDRALIAITADHGMSFDVGVNDRRTATRRNLDEIAPVPFFLKAPGQTTGRVERRYGSTMDIVPTIADLLDLPLDWRAEGRSRLGGGPRVPRVVTFPTRFFSGVIRSRRRAFERRRAANIRRRARRFGTGAQSSLLFGSPWSSVYRQGPRPGLVGRPLHDLRVLPAAVSARFAPGERWRSVRPRAKVVPTQVAGSIPAGRRAGRMVAVAVNGRIRALARTFRLRGGAREQFSLVVPDSSLRAGRNRVELFEVAGRGRSLRLMRLARSS